MAKTGEGVTVKNGVGMRKVWRGMRDEGDTFRDEG